MARSSTDVSNPGAHHLDGGDLGASLARAHLIDQPRRVQHQQPRLLDLQAGLGDARRHHALIRQRPPERHPRQGPPAGHLQRALGGPQHPHRVVDPAGAEPGLRDGEPAAFLAEQVRPGNPSLGEGDLAVPVLIPEAEDGQRSHDVDTGRAARDEEHRLLLVIGSGWVRLAHDDEELATRIAGTGGPPLPAVDHVVVAVAHDRGRDVAGVRGRDLRLGHGEPGAHGALEQRLQPAGLLLRGPEQVEQLHVAGIRSRTVQGLRGEVRRTSHHLGQVGVLVVRQPRDLGQEQVPQTPLAGRCLELLDDRRQLVVVGSRAGAGLRVDRLRGIHVSVHEVLQLAERPRGSVGQGREHRASGGRVDRVTLASIWWVPLRRAALARE